MQTGKATPEVIGNRYVLERPLGTGGMGAVYLAADRLTGETVALKRVQSVAGSGSGVAGELRLALSREFKTLASLRHPNLISVLDYGFDNQRQPYFTMTVVPNARTLREAGRGQPFTVRIDLIIQILQALVYLHRRGLIHRDLKPDNAVVTRDGKVKLLDFGLVLLRGQNETEPHAGTLRYMAPEVVQGETPDVTADLYAVGVMAYELITGRHPFEGASPHEVLHNVLVNAPDMAPIEAATRGAAPAGEPVSWPATPAPTTSDDDDDEPTEIVSRTLLISPNTQDETGNEADLRAEPTPNDPTTQAFNGLALPPVPATPAHLMSVRRSTNPFVAIIGKLLAKTPRERYRDARQVINDLRAAMGDLTAAESSEIRDSFLQAARFVGREAELSQLSAAIQRALDSHGGLWLVGGESGVGKSRLLDEVRALGMVEGMLVLRGNAVGEGGLPYQLWREPLRRLVLSVEPSDTEAAVVKPIVPDIERLIGRIVPNAPALDGPDAQQRLQSTIVDLFERACQVHHNREGIMLLIEDLQWASQELSIIQALGASAKHLPLLILGSYRQDEAPDLPRHLPSGSVIDLKRLSRTSVMALSESMLGDAGRQPAVVELLQRETEGNVYFLIEVARALAEDAGQLERIGRTALPERVAAGGIQAIIQRRLDQLPATFRPLLRLAAVAGRQLDLAILGTLAGSVNLEDWLTACANAAIIDRQDERWRFAHDKLREQLLADLADDERRSLYRQVARATETVYAASAAQRAAMLAHLWANGGDPAQELHYSRLAAEQALAISAYTDAQGFLERTLDLITSDSTKPTRQIEVEVEVEIRIKLGDVYQALGNYDRATDYLRAALAMAQAADQRRLVARALLSLGWVCIRQGNPTQARAYSTDSLIAIHGADDPLLLLDVFFLTSLTFSAEGQYADAQQLLQEALPLARRSGDPTRLANILNAFGAVAEGMGQHLAAYRYLSEAHDIAHETGNRYLSATVQATLGRLEYSQGLYTPAREHFEAALDLFRDIGGVYGEANALQFLGFIALADGHDATATIYFHESIRLSMKIGAVTLTLIALCGVARLLANEGKPEQAVELLGLLLNHAASSADVDVERAGVPMLNRLVSELPPEVLDAALERGKERDLTEFAGELVDLKRSAL